MDAGQGPAPKRAVNMDVARREHFGTGLHRRQDNQVTFRCVDLLAGADRLGDDFGRRWVTGSACRGCNNCRFRFVRGRLFGFMGAIPLTVAGQQCQSRG